MALNIFDLLIYLVAKACVVAHEDGNDPSYGSQWLLYMDESGYLHEMNFSTLPLETRGFSYGKVYCYLYTRENNKQGELLVPPDDENDNIESKYFKESGDIKAITHGWLSKENTDWIQNIKNAILGVSDVNVLTVDWSELADNPVYPWSAFSTRYVGKYLAKIIRSLMKTYGVKNSRIHLIGHSLGAQVMGYAGMYSGEKIHRITGLDPARPLFELPLMDPNFRLDPSDANFVDIIHTCGGILGYRDSHGHADFYPNGGKAPQPGCGGIKDIIEGCSHGRSHEYFLESIDSDIGFDSYPCEDWKEFKRGECRNDPAMMGYPADNHRVGDFFLYTNNHSKYAVGSE
ncbi:inactive pancreatic lipase-related protein 1-like [Ostrinia furnacalis]|uniref:inactive pancreatic lipase-related protein 1-like n=1 Tax=Ostrinia furnacalis TaxID=93504 RepID=UPI001039D175|nr:inactive pancreatic lipase-related protein 1-like [Ostrinia furnacalis]